MAFLEDLKADLFALERPETQLKTPSHPVFRGYKTFTVRSERLPLVLQLTVCIKELPNGDLQILDLGTTYGDPPMPIASHVEGLGFEDQESPN